MDKSDEERLKLGLAKFDKEINDNKIYDQLALRWYEAQDDPIALLRNQQKIELPWVLSEIRRNIGYHAEILDLGCGGGLLSNAFALAGHRVTGLDLSISSLKVAELKDSTRRVRYIQGDIYKTPFANESFDVVVAMDILEHISDPQEAIKEATRVLRPGGLFFFKTFNKNPVTWLIAVKGLEWFIKNTPANYHVYSLFIPPKQLCEWIEDAGMELRDLRGIRPLLTQKPLFQLIQTGIVPVDFSFKFTRSLLINYAGFAKKLREH